MSFRTNCWKAVAVALALVALPAPASAEWLGFRNETKQPIIVQRASIVKRQIRWGKPIVLYPGEVSWQAVAQPGVKPLAIYDAKKRPLFKDNLNCGKDDQFFAIRASRPGVVKLVPVKITRKKKKPSQ